MYYFVYGSLKKGFGNHRLIANCAFVGNGSVKGFNMYSLGAFPTVVKTAEPNLIYGEVYNVTSSHVEYALDCLEGYSHDSDCNLYDKNFVTVTLSDGKQVEAYIYCFSQKPHTQRIEDGIWTRDKKTNLFY